MPAMEQYMDGTVQTRRQALNKLNRVDVDNFLLTAREGTFANENT